MRFGRRSGREPDEGAVDQSDAGSPEPAAEVSPSGPLDADDLDLEDDPAFADHVDLGGLLLPPPQEGLELRLQVDETSGSVLSVLLAGEDGALELRPFAASRNADLWAEVRPQIAADTARHGGTATEQDGPFGTELVCRVPVQAPDGSAATQPSRMIGVNGPRWLLRATLLGRPAMEPEAAAPWEDALRNVVVRRGSGAMPPGEPIELTLPPDSERVE